MSDWLGALIGAVERAAYRFGEKKKPKRNPVLMNVNWAKQAGIHPLVAIQGGFQPSDVTSPQGGWSSGFGEALGSIGDAYMSQQQLAEDAAAGEANYDRRRAEDRMFEREMQRLRSSPTPMDKYYEALTKQVQLQTKKMELEHAAMGATTGHNSYPLPPEVVDTPMGRMVPRYPFLSQRLEQHYGEGGEVAAALAGAEDLNRTLSREARSAGQPLRSQLQMAPLIYSGPLTSAPYGSKKRRY